jgi:hypothetical protein
VEDWGYKFIATVQYPLKVINNNRSNWLLKLSFELVQSLAIIGAGMVQGPPWNEELENSYGTWMENSLVKPELFTLADTVSVTSEADESEQFLFGILNRKTNNISDEFLRKMRNHVLEDQGTIEAVNKAVYATCAAIIRANNLTAEAIGFAKGLRPAPTPLLIKAWKAGQKMRNYFDLNDVRQSQDRSQQGKSKRSLYAGAPEEVVNAASDAVVSRAKFLLRTAVMDNRMMNDATISVNETSNTPTKSVSSHAELAAVTFSPANISPFSVPIESLSPEQKSNINKWQLASKAIKLQRQVSIETKNVAVMWHSLVDEAVVLDKLKNVFLHRRKHLERATAAKEFTLTEKILNFVQSDVDIAKMHDVNTIRNKRAIVRSKGFDVFARLLHQEASPFAVFIATSTYVTAVTKFRSIERSEIENFHYAHSLEGCSPEQNNLLWQKFSLFLNNSVLAIRKAYSRMCADNSDKILWEKAVVNSMRACAMDYDITDHQTIFDSGIVGILEQILRGTQSVLVRQTAGALLETIVSRFIVFDSTLETGEPTQLSKMLISTLASLLASSNKSEILISKAELKESSSNIPSPLLSIEEIVSIQSMSASRILPHCDLPWSHTISFSVARGRTLLDGADSTNIKTGAHVTRSKFWEIDDKSRPDGGLGSVGIIGNVLDGGHKVLVKWPHGKEVS